MKRRDSLLAAARRRRNSLGRFVLAWFAVAWFTLAGAPCLAMANANVDAREHAAEAHAHGHHGHATSHGDSAPAMGRHDHAATQKGPAHCPHCPPSAAMPAHAPSIDHSFCAAYDEVADQTCFAPPSFAKHVVLAPAFAAPPPLQFHPPRSSPRATGTQRSTIALNLRNCVLLI